MTSITPDLNSPEFAPIKGQLGRAMSTPMISGASGSSVSGRATVR